MVITRTPYRLSLFGGGTDYPEWYRLHGGQVLAGAIDRFCYLTVRWLPPFFEHRHRIVYSRVESVREVAEIAHPAVRAALGSFQIRDGVELHHDGDLPARSGIGTSAAFAVGLLHALGVLTGRSCDRWSLAREAVHLERELLQETGGVQDQYTCALGGFHHFRFGTDGSVVSERSERLERVLPDLERWLVLLYSGVQRYSHEVSQPLLGRIEQTSPLLARTAQIVSEARRLIEDGSEESFAHVGGLMDETWQIKQELNPGAVTARLAGIYAEALDNGALGGKVSGAGGGGFMLFVVPPGRRESFLGGMAGVAMHVPFRFTPHGSEVLYVAA